MKRLASVFVLGTAFAASAAFGADAMMVGGQRMYPTKDIADNAVNSSDHTTLVAAVKAAGLVDTLNANISTCDVIQSKGVIQVIDAVLMPK